MRPRRPHRLSGFDYRGFHRYFLTYCTHQRRPHFRRATIVGTVLTQFRRAAMESDVALLAYCFMPDHVHLLVEGVSEGADGSRFIFRSRQGSAYECRVLCEPPFWQRAAYDHVLRDSVATLPVARYIIENPVRARMVTTAEDYPYSGSDRFSIREILEAALWDRTRTPG